MHKPAGFHSVLKPVAIVIFGFLFTTLLARMGPNTSQRLRDIGEFVWTGYKTELRQEQIKPDCNQQELKAKLADCSQDDSQSAKGTERNAVNDKDFDPFAEPEPAKKAEPEDFDPFAEEAVQKPKDQADFDPFAEGGAEAEKDPFATEIKPAKMEFSCAAMRNLYEECANEHVQFAKTAALITPGVESFRSFDRLVSKLGDFLYWKHLLILLCLFGMLAATLQRTHIALREANNRFEHIVSQGTQLAVHLSWAVSCYYHFEVQQESARKARELGLEVVQNDTVLAIIWGVGFALMAICNVYHLSRIAQIADGKRSVARLFMVIPLYTYMGLIGAFYFLLGEQHWSGQAIYLDKFVENYEVFLGIGLYIWAGMLFATTRVARLCFDILMPWKLPMSVMVWLTVVFAAVPTAYSGASGIFVIAAGAVIFERLTAAGATKRMALTATAMSGSLGVVLSPCLVVVLIAALNKVQSQQLFDKGIWVFLLTATLLLIAVLLRYREPWQVRSVSQAAPESLQALKPLFPYLLVTIVVVLMYGFGLTIWLNENTAPLMLPGILLAVVVWERMFIRPGNPQEADQKQLWPTLVSATTESSVHIGALLILMAASIGLGGVVERAELLDYFPADFGSPALAMMAMVWIMVIVGMTMDALGAVVLVSVTLAKVAEQNGIDPVHFWMMVLVAFELGYLTPPVALNHLLARQVIGEASHVEDDDDEGFWLRNEHLWLPMAVMGVALVIVAFVPFFFY